MATASSFETTTTNVSVGTSPTLILAANLSRKSCLIQNLGASVVYIGGSGVATTTGIQLFANGGSYTSDTNKGAIYGISGSAGQDVRAEETA